MRAVLLVALLALPALAPTAAAWLPVCKELDESVDPYVHVHASLDCERSVTAEVCPPRGACRTVHVGTGLP